MVKQHPPGGQTDGRTTTLARERRKASQQAGTEPDENDSFGAESGYPPDGGPQPPPAARPGGAGGFGLRFYKPGQGYYTRVGTAIGAGVLIVGGAAFLFNELKALLDPSTGYALPVTYGVSVAFMVLMGAVVYWVVGVNRKANDFFIATEGEMKKVSWSTRKEVTRSTKVVIVTVVLMGSFLFTADIVFIFFMNAIGVLRTGVGVLEAIGIE